MPKIAIEMQAETSSVASIAFPPDTGFRFVLRCCNCGEQSPKPVVISMDDEVEGIRGASVSIKITCKFCKRTNDLKLLKTFAYEAEKRGWQKAVEMECRGVEPSKFILDDTVPLSIKGTSGYEFEEACIDDGEFYGYDEKENTDASVTEWESRVVKL